MPCGARRVAPAVILATALALAQSPLRDSQGALAKGDYRRAIDLAAAEAQFHSSGDVRGEAQAANLIGQASLHAADYANALRSFERSLALNRKAGNAEAVVTAENNIGSIHFFQGRYTDALQVYNQALADAQGAVGEPWSRRSLQLTLVNLGVLFGQLGLNDRALACYRQANLTPSALPADEQSQLFSNQGTLYRRMGDPARALATYAAAQRWFAQRPNPDAEIQILHDLGILITLDYRDTARALAAFEKALELARSTGNRRQAVLGRLLRAEALYRGGRYAEARSGFAEALAGAREIGGREEEWSALFGLGRADRLAGNTSAALDEFAQAIAIIESVRAGLTRASLKTDFLGEKRDVYDAAIDLRLATSQPDAAALFALMEQARGRTLQEALRRPVARSALAAVQQRLSRGELLLEYWLGPERGAGLWITRGSAGAIAMVSPQPLSRFASQLESGADWRESSRRLGAQLLAGIPLADLTRIWIVPDGDLQRLPFEALEAGGKLLIERAPVAYLPVASMLRPTRQGQVAAPWERQASLYGDPSPTQGATFGADTRWQPLPQARAEMEAVARALPGRTAIYAGDADRKSRLLTEAAPPVLHFATHAVVDLADANRSRILFSGSQYLFWKEVQALDLTRTDLVTLAACGTESGPRVRGEGMLSFSRAFLAAGAAATVTPLWRVADQPTSEFMKQFYLRLGRGDEKSQALRAAKLRFLNSGTPLAHPRYWAAFVLNGDGQTPLPPVLSWTQLASAGVALLAVVVLALYRRRRGPPANRGASPSAPGTLRSPES